MARFFLPPAAWQSTARLEEEESRHCAQVLRLSTGDDITVFDGRGRSARATILQVSKHSVSLEIGETTQHTAPYPAIILAQAVPKGKTIEWIIEKAVELGVSQIAPLVTRHTIVKYDAQEAIKKAEKWQKVALEACKQCGQNWLPQVLPPIDGRTFLETPREGAKIIASLAAGALSLKHLIAESAAAGQVTVMIGPEGDFSDDETQLALNAGYRPATLGPLVLRSETAALYAMASLRCLLSC